MQFSNTIMHIRGCEVQVLGQEDSISEDGEFVNPDPQPNVFVIVARSQRQLDFVFDNYTGADLKNKLLATAPDLQAGLPQGRAAVMVFIRGEQWTTSNDNISIDPKTGVLYLKFHHTPDTTQSRSHILVTDNQRFPLRINAEFHDPFSDYPPPSRRSPHGKSDPEGWRLN